jgi:type I restriction enzyme S subunit
MRNENPMNFKQTEISSIPEDWEVLGFEDAIIKKRIKVGKIKQKEYKRIGEYPVIDQSQNYIAGYTDEKDKLYQGVLPVIIFGDHTRIFKFVDFPFVTGADGVKVILTDNSKFDSKFFYYAMLELKIESRGYNRHYPLLREKKISHPPILEQQKIARVLGKIQQAIEQQDKIIEATKNLKKSLMQKLFTEGLGHREFKEAEIGQIPKNWEVVKLEQVCKPRKEIAQPMGEGKIKYIGLEHIDSGKTALQHFGSDSDVRSSKNRFYNGDILYGKLRPYLDKAVVTEFDGICSTDIIVISTNSNKAVSDYIVNLLHLSPFVSYATSTMTGVNHPRTSWKAIGAFKIPLPSLPEQQEIAHILITVDKKIEFERKRKSTLKELFKTMLHKLMTGEIRLKEIEP